MNDLKKIGLLFYTAGRFEGLRTDANSVIEYLSTKNPNAIQNKKDLSLLDGMRHAWYAIKSDHKLTIQDYVNAHKAMVASTNVLYPGELRTRPVRVSFGGGERLLDC